MEDLYKSDNFYSKVNEIKSSTALNQVFRK